MRYLSLFSGVEAATVAWEPLGWEAVAFAEIEPFPSAVLAHHWPDVPNLGDVSQITEEMLRELGHIDLVVGGSPCQDLSVAGKGKGLAGERSGLFHEQIRIFHLCRKLYDTRYLLWENVPGAITSNKGRDFTTVVAELAGLINIATPKYGWGKEGAAVGDHGLLEWCCLDAQWFGLAQRRRRVFALLDTGDWTSRPPILLERESLRGDTPPSREAQEEVTTNVTSGAAMGPLMAGSPSGGGRPLPAVAFAIKATAIGRKPENGGNGLGVELETCPTLTVADRHAVGFRMVAFGECSGDDTASTMKARDYKDATDLVAHPQEYIVRRLTPTECARLQGFPDNHVDIQYSTFFRPAKPAPDGQKYKAYGNSMAVNVMRYIGEQIQSSQ